MSKTKLPKKYNDLLKALKKGKTVQLELTGRESFSHRLRIVTPNDCFFREYFQFAQPSILGWLDLKHFFPLRSCFIVGVRRKPENIVREMYNFDRGILRIKRMMILD